MKNFKQKTLLRGEGIHQHTLYGEFETDTEVADKDFTKVTVKEQSLLKHEHPNGSFAEHKGLHLKEGNWVMGRQVEYSPFTGDITKVWD